jgi:hypothetical protein
MIKKIILGVVVFGISAGLIYGGVYRTIARTETEERANQSERNISLSQGNSGEGNQGQGINRTSSSNGQQEGRNESESNRVTDAGFSAEISDSIALNGFYETADKFEVLFIENLTKGIEVQIREESGRPLWAGNGRGT